VTDWRDNPAYTNYVGYEKLWQPRDPSKPQEKWITGSTEGPSTTYECDRQIGIT